MRLHRAARQQREPETPALCAELLQAGTLPIEWLTRTREVAASILRMLHLMLCSGSGRLPPLQQTAIDMLEAPLQHAMCYRHIVNRVIGKLTRGQAGLRFRLK